MDRLAMPNSSRQEILRAQNGEEREPLGVLGSRLGRVDHDGQVRPDHAEDVAVQGQRTNLRMVDDLSRPFGWSTDTAGFPQFGELFAVGA
jgi:hypothetical protein